MAISINKLTHKLIRYPREALGLPHLTFFDAFYFIVVTISTVGYGDVAPTTWMSKMVVALMIAVTIVIIPIEVQQLQQVQYT